MASSPDVLAGKRRGSELKRVFRGQPISLVPNHCAPLVKGGGTLWSRRRPRQDITALSAVAVAEHVTET